MPAVDVGPVRMLRDAVVTHVDDALVNCRLDIHPLRDPTVTLRQRPFSPVTTTFVPARTVVTGFAEADGALRSGISLLVFIVRTVVVEGAAAEISWRPDTQPDRDPTVTYRHLPLCRETTTVVPFARVVTGVFDDVGVGRRGMADAVIIFRFGSTGVPGRVDSSCNPETHPVRPPTVTNRHFP